MTLPPIANLVPHSGAMLLLDRALQADPESLCAEVRIHAGSQFASGEGVASWIGVEYMAQAVAAHAGYLAYLKGEAVKPGLLLGSRRYSTTQPVFPLGATLHVQVRQVLRGDNGLGAFECTITPADGAEPAAQPVASATLTVFQPDDVNEFLQGIKNND